jgi:hypothetical protein
MHVAQERRSMFRLQSDLPVKWGSRTRARSLETTTREHHAFERSVGRKDGGGTSLSEPLAQISLIHPTSATVEFMPRCLSPHTSGFQAVRCGGWLIGELQCLVLG